MSNVVSLSYLNLLRARKQMTKAFRQGDWEAVKEWDVLLTHQLGAAFDDPSRDNQLLVDELEAVLGLYAEMVAVLPDVATQSWLTPGSSQV